MMRTQTARPMASGARTLPDSAAEGAALADRLLDGVLANVPFDGWSNTALIAAARAAGLSEGAAARAFPGGVADAVREFSRRIDSETAVAAAELDLGALRVRERVAAVVRIRIRLLAPHREAVRRLLSWLALPPNAPLAARLTLRASDTLWRAIGDRSTDFSYYTKRAILAGVWSATVLYWLGDRSDDFEDTWAFLDRRIDEVVKVLPRLNPGRLLGRLPIIGRAFASIKDSDPQPPSH